MKSKLLRVAFLATLTTAIAASPAMAATVDASDPKVLLDNVFVLVAAIFVIFMQAGFALVEAGLTRAKNAAHMMLKNLMDFVVASVGFALIGFHIAFSGSDYLGFDWQWAEFDTASKVTSNLTVPVLFLFNMGFAAAAATIASGAVAERVQLRAYFIYSIVISTLIYPVVVSWVWGGGWLSKMDTPFVDFAGSSVVHVTGGVAALTGATILGARIGRYDDEGNSLPIPGHNLSFTILGVFVLLVGWFGFNAGSLLSADLQIGMIATITALGAGAGGIGATLASWLTLKTPDVTLVGNGVLGGLVSITAGAASFSIFGAIIVGFIAGIIAANGVFLLDRFRCDDPVGAIPVHLMCGAWGTLIIGFLADPGVVPGGNGPAGLLYGGSLSLLISQIIGLAAITTYVGLTTGMLFLTLRSIGWLRVSAEAEMIGLDLAEHATPAYNEDYVDYDDLAEDDFSSEMEEFLEDLSSL